MNPNLGFALQLRMLDPPGAWASLLSTRPEGGDAAGVGAWGGGPASWDGGAAWPPPWDLDRFLDAREACGPGGADDRTMQVGQIHVVGREDAEAETCIHGILHLISGRCRDFSLPLDG